jgi:hypothetical protein
MTVQGLIKRRCLQQLSIWRAFFLPAFWLATSSGPLFPPDVGRERAGAPGAMISNDRNDPNDEPLRDFPVALTVRLRNTPPPGRARAEGEEMTAASHGRRSWKDSPKAKRIAATISLLLIAGLIAMLAVAFLFTQ